MKVWILSKDGTSKGWDESQCLEIYRSCCNSMLFQKDPETRARLERLMRDALNGLTATDLYDLEAEGFGLYFWTAALDSEDTFGTVEGANTV